MKYPSIGLAGRSGSGKSTIAKYLATKYGYKICYPGGKVRFITKELFNEERKPLLNKVSSAFRKLRPRIWLDLALEELDTIKDLIVVDGIRYPEDFQRLRELDFLLIVVECPDNLLTQRLEQREGNVETNADLLPYEENALRGFSFDVTVENGNINLTALFDEIDRQITKWSEL